MKVVSSTLDHLVTFEELCRGFSKHPYFLNFMKVATRDTPSKDERRDLKA